MTDHSHPTTGRVPCAGNGLLHGVEEGWINPPKRTKLSKPEPVDSTTGFSIRQALEEDRG